MSKLLPTPKYPFISADSHHFECIYHFSMAMGNKGPLNIAPLVSGQHALLGEAGKVTAVSAYRFASVSSGSGGIVVSMRGKPGELVTLLFATRSGPSGPFACKSRVTTIGAGGTASMSFSG